ncbi:hypothetical protein ACQP3L_37010, partial [Escherichia coli]
VCARDCRDLQKQKPGVRTLKLELQAAGKDSGGYLLPADHLSSTLHTSEHFLANWSLHKVEMMHAEAGQLV